MAVQPGPTDKRYDANGVSPTYTVPFLVIEAGDLKVYLNSALLTSGYTHTGVGLPISSITFATPPAGDLYLQLEVPFQRLVDYQENGDFLASTVNRDLDRIWQALKQLFGWAARSLRLGNFDIDGSGWYRAKGNGIRDLNDPIESQDAATKHSVEAYVASILETGQGPINNAANVVYVYPDGIARPLSTLATKNNSLLGSAGIAHKDGNVYEALSALELPPQAQNSVLRTLSGSTVGDLSAFLRAVAAGEVTVVYAGDSIAEGKSQVNPPDSWTMVFSRALQEAYKGVKFNFVNLSLAGRGTGNLASDAYVGIAGPDNPLVGFYYPPGSQYTGHWPEGSTIGKSWKEHIRDQAPDLIIQALGMNDLTGDSNDNAGVARLCLDYYNTFSKVPSIAFMTPMQPSNTVPPFDGFQDRIRVNAEIYRGLCAQFNHTLLDANRLSFLHRDAVDVFNSKGYKRLVGGFPNGWTILSGSGYILSGETLIGGGITRRDEATRDVFLDATFTLANYSTMVPGVSYRMELAAPDNCYTVQIQSGTTAILYWRNTVLTSDLITTLVNGMPVRIQVECRGARHKIYVNRVLVFTWYDYNKLNDGSTSVSIEGGSGSISDYTMVKFEPLVVGRPMFSQGDLLGYVNDFDTNPNSLGGSATNHPSALGHSVMYADACLPLIKLPAPAGSLTVFAAATSVDNFYGATPGPSAKVRIDGIDGPTLLVGGATGGEVCFLSHVKRVIGGRSIVVSVQSTSSLGTGTILPVILALPPGSWIVTVRATLSRNASGVLNALDAVATKEV